MQFPRSSVGLNITSLNSHLSEIYSDTKYGILSMRTKRNPHCPYASGDTRKEELTKRLCSLVDNSQDSYKKVPSAKNAPTDQSSERPMGDKGKGQEHGQRVDFRLQIGDRQNWLNRLAGKQSLGIEQGTLHSCLLLTARCWLINRSFFSW